MDRQTDEQADRQTGTWCCSMLTGRRCGYSCPSMTRLQQPPYPPTCLLSPSTPLCPHTTTSGLCGKEHLPHYFPQQRPTGTLRLARGAHTFLPPHHPSPFTSREHAAVGALVAHELTFLWFGADDNLRWRMVAGIQHLRTLLMVHYCSNLD